MQGQFLRMRSRQNVEADAADLVQVEEGTQYLAASSKRYHTFGMRPADVHQRSVALSTNFDATLQQDPSVKWLYLYVLMLASTAPYLDPNQRTPNTSPDKKLYKPRKSQAKRPAVEQLSTSGDSDGDDDDDGEAGKAPDAAAASSPSEGGPATKKQRFDPSQKHTPRQQRSGHRRKQHLIAPPAVDRSLLFIAEALHFSDTLVVSHLPFRLHALSILRCAATETCSMTQDI